MINPRWYLLGIVLTVLASIAGYQAYDRYEVRTETKLADQHGAKGEVHDQVAESLQPKLDEANAQLVKLKAKLAQLKLSAPAPVQTGGAVQETPPANQSDVKDEIIAAEDARYEIQSEQLKEVASARDEYRAEATSLRSVISHTPKERPWSAGLLYGTDKTIGAWVERDFGPIRIGADVVRHPLDTTGRTALEATARIGLRF